MQVNIRNLNTIKKDLLNKIERFEIFEERFEISIQKVSIAIDESWDITIFCEIHPTNGNSIKDDFSIEYVVYDENDFILAQDKEYIISEDFFWFKILKIWFYNRSSFQPEQISKIRLYPTSFH